MNKIEKMASFLKQAFEKEKISEEDFLITDIKNQIDEKINLKIKSNKIIDEKILRSFWGRHSINKIDTYYLWNEFRDILLSNIKIGLNNKNNYQIYLSMELSVFFTRLINMQNKFEFNQIYNFLDYEYIHFQNIFNSVINCLDKINLIPIIINQTKQNKEQAIKITQKHFWREFDLDDIKFLNEVKKYNFRNTFFKNFFYLKIDKVNFYENFLLENRNQNTHYPITNVEIKDTHEFNQIIEIIKNNSNENILIKHKELCKDNKRGIVLATLYLFLVYEEMIKINIEDFELYFSHKSKRSTKQWVN